MDFQKKIFIVWFYHYKINKLQQIFHFSIGEGLYRSHQIWSQDIINNIFFLPNKEGHEIIIFADIFSLVRGIKGTAS